MFGWFKEKVVGKLVEHASESVPPRMIWLIIAIIALLIFFFAVPEQPDTEEPTAEDDEPRGGAGQGDGK